MLLCVAIWCSIFCNLLWSIADIVDSSSSKHAYKYCEASYPDLFKLATSRCIIYRTPHGNVAMTPALCGGVHVLLSIA